MAGSFKIMSVKAVNGDIVFEVEHYNDGTPIFLEEYDFQGRQGAVYEADISPDGRPWLDDGTLPPLVDDPATSWNHAPILNWKIPAGRTPKYTNVLLLKEENILGIISRHHMANQSRWYDGRSNGAAQAEAVAQIDKDNVQTLVDAFGSMAGKTYEVTV